MNAFEQDIAYAVHKIKGREINPNYKRKHPHKQEGGL